MFLLIDGKMLDLKFFAFVQNEEFIVLAFDPLLRNVPKLKAVFGHICKQKKKPKTRQQKLRMLR